MKEPSRLALLARFLYPFLFITFSASAASATENPEYVRDRIAANTYVDSRYPMGQFSGIKFFLHDAKNNSYSRYPEGFREENSEAINLAATEDIRTMSKRAMKPHIDEMCRIYEAGPQASLTKDIYRIAALMNQAGLAEAKQLHEYYARVDLALSENGRNAVNSMMLVDPRTSPKPTKRIDAVGLANDIPGYVHNQARIACHRHLKGRLPDDVLAAFDKLKSNPIKIDKPSLDPTLEQRLYSENEARGKTNYDQQESSARSGGVLGLEEI